MRALYLILPILCILAIAYRYYSAFIAARIMGARRPPRDAGAPAERRPELSPDPPAGPLRPSLRRDHRRRPADRAGAGRAVRLGPRAHLAGRRRLPGRRRPRLHHPLGLDPARRTLARRDRPRGDRPGRGRHRAVAILFIIVIALAGLGLAVVNALQESAWGTFTIGMSIPLALFMGLYMYRFRKGRIARRRPSGSSGLLLAVILGKPLAASAWVRWFQLSREQLIVAMAAYGFVASVLPVWLLLCPRDYLSSFMKIGTIAFLVIAVMRGESGAPDAGGQRSSPPAAGRSFPARCSRSPSSPSPAARSPASTR